MKRVLWAVALLVAATASAADISNEIAAVEKIRGLHFKAPVKTIEINRSDLPAHLREQFAKTLPYSVEEWGDVLRALRLIPAESKDDQIVSSLLDLYQQQVLAYYDPPSKTFYTVRQLPDALQSMSMGGALNSGVVVHELTHALQDQYFQIGARDLALRDDVDANLALHAVLEGEASLVMLQYMIEHSGGSFDDMIKSDMLTSALSAAASASLPSGGPAYFTEMLKFPYIDGLKFVIDGYRRGGWKALDAIDANPPQSTREILHPSDYFDHKFKPVPFTKGSAPDEHLGEWHWRFLTGSGEGWRSDRVTLARDAFCETTVLVDTQWDTPAQAQRFFDAYTKRLDDIGSLGRIDGTRVRVAYGADRKLMDQFLK